MKIETGRKIRSILIDLSCEFINIDEADNQMDALFIEEDNKRQTEITKLRGTIKSLKNNKP